MLGKQPHPGRNPASRQIQTSHSLPKAGRRAAAISGAAEPADRERGFCPRAGVRDLVAAGNATAGESLTVATGTPVFRIGPQYATWTLLRSGPTADFTDAWDNAVHFSGALGVSNGVGVAHAARICNQTRYNETLASPGPSVTLVPATMVVGPNSCGLFTITLTSGSGSYAMTITGG